MNCKDLANKLVNQHFDPAALRKRFEVFVEKYFDTYLGEVWDIFIHR